MLEDRKKAEICNIFLKYHSTKSEKYSCNISKQKMKDILAILKSAAVAEFVLTLPPPWQHLAPPSRIIHMSCVTKQQLYVVQHQRQQVKILFKAEQQLLLVRRQAKHVSFPHLCKRPGHLDDLDLKYKKIFLTDRPLCKRAAHLDDPDKKGKIFL